MVVRIVDLDWIDDQWMEKMENVTYQGALFTGTAVDKDDDTGRLLTEAIYEKGYLLEKKTWSWEGALSTHYVKEPFVYEKFYPNGSIKIQKSAGSTKKYYENGKILELFEYGSNCAVFYDKDDKWILRHRADEDHQLSMNGEKITFHDEVMRRQYLGLLEETFDVFEDYIALWLETISSEERAQIVCDMIASDNLWIKEKGICFAEKHQVSQSLELLEKERNNDAGDARRKNFDGDNTCYLKSISKSARHAIGTLKNKELWEKLAASLQKEVPALQKGVPTFDEELYKKVTRRRTPLFEGPQGERVIREWEKKISVTFPRSYVEFLKTFGDGIIHGEAYFYGISNDEFSAVYNYTDEYRKMNAVPKELLVVSSYNRVVWENNVSHVIYYLICLDTGRMCDGDCPAVLCTLKDYELVSVEEYAANFWGAFNMAHEKLLKELEEQGEQAEEFTLPDGTGFGCCWMVVEGASHKAVVETLLEEQIQKYEYKDGVKLANAAGGKERLLAVTAANEKRIYVIGSAVSGFFYNTERFLQKIKHFKKVYVYMTEHVSETHGFALVEKGEIKRLFFYNEEEIKNIGASTTDEMALAYRLPQSFEDVQNKDEIFTEVNEDMLVELAILQVGIDAEKYPYKKVTVGKMAL